MADHDKPACCYAYFVSHDINQHNALLTQACPTVITNILLTVEMLNATKVTVNYTGMCLLLLWSSTAVRIIPSTQTTSDITSARMSNTRPVIPSALSPRVSVESPDVSIMMCSKSFLQMFTWCLGYCMWWVLSGTSSVRLEGLSMRLSITCIHNTFHSTH